MMGTSKFLVALGTSLLVAAAAIAADPPASAPRDRAAPPLDRAAPGQPGALHQGGEKMGVATSFPVKSKLTGLNVRNPAGEKLGTVEDIVIDVQDGKSQYLALSTGGVLGIGN